MVLSNAMLRQPLVASDDLSNIRPPPVDLGVNVAAPVCALVVTHFHPSQGNRIEWQHPATFNSTGVEFKTMPAGAQDIEQDYVFFRHHGLYGCACFHRMWTGEKTERQVRMRSVAAFSAKLHVLRRYQAQLSQHVRRLNEIPEDMSPLLGILRSAAADASAEARAALGVTIAASGAPLNLGADGKILDLSDSTPKMSLSARTSAGSFSNAFHTLTEFLGATVLTVWKALLLRRRIMFCAPPPVGPACERALCASMLLSNSAAPVQKLFPDKSRPEALCYVTLGDTEMLDECQFGYVACTSEKLFEEKDHLWDVYLDASRLVIDEKDGRILQLTNRDKERFHLLRQADEQARTTGDNAVQTFFDDLNGRLFSGIESLLDEGVRVLTPELMETKLGMGNGDAFFVRELFRMLGIHQIKVKDHARCCFNCN